MTDPGGSAAAEAITIALVDDQALFRGGIRMLIGSQPDLRVVGEASDGRQAVELAARTRPQVILMDVRMPVMDGIEATKAILAEADARGTEPPRIIVLTTFDLDEAAATAIRAGASGFVLKDAARAVRTLPAGAHAAGRTPALRRTHRSGAGDLPPRGARAEQLGDRGGRVPQ
jgi:DNA-binding NarL/FixJ family response regulator